MPDFIDLRQGPVWLKPDDNSQIFQEAQKMSLQRQEFELQKQQYGALNQLRAQELDIRRKSMEQELELHKLQVENLIQKRQDDIEAEKAFQEVTKRSALQGSIGILGTPAAEAATLDVIANNPKFWKHPGAKPFMEEMAATRKTKDLATQRAADAAASQLRVETQQAGLNLRKRWDTATREYIAETRSDAQVQASENLAKSRVQAAEVAASKWKDHSRFAAFKSAAASIATAIAPEKEPEKYAEAVKDIYNRLLPTGEPNAWDTTSAAEPTTTPAVPVTSKSDFKWTPNGIKQVGSSGGESF